jgi:hypothetical protein
VAALAVWPSGVEAMEWCRKWGGMKEGVWVRLRRGEGVG